MIEPKVKVSTVTALVTCAVMWALGRYVYPHGTPAGVLAFLQAAIPAACTMVAGYLAPHQQR